MTFEEFCLSVPENAKYERDYAVIYPALGLAGEAGEAVDIIKKSIRYKRYDETFSLKTDQKDRTEDMKLELGDVMWYWVQLVKDLNLDIEEIFQMNYDKLNGRYKT